MEKIRLSTSLEDYLEAIAELSNTHEHAHTKDIAERLKVSMPSVTSALRALAEKGLIEYQSYTPITLTAIGREVADKIMRRHRTLEHFFSDVLKLDRIEADKVACQVEHVIPDEVIRRLLLLADKLQQMPDFQMDYSGMEENALLPATVTTLDRMPVGKTGVVLAVAPELRGAKRFADLGLVPGARLTMEPAAPLGDPLRIRVKGCSLSFRRSEAKYISVKLIG